MGGSSVDANVLGVQFADGTYQMTAATSSYPQVAWSQIFTGLTTPTSPNVPLITYTITANGIYRVSADIYPTTLNSGSWVVEVLAGFSQTNQAGITDVDVALCQLQAGSASITPGASAMGQFNVNAVIKFYTVAVSGSESGGVYSVVTLIERLA
jgi:hypothetical protein